MKKRIGIAVLLVSVIAGAVWAEREVLPAIALTDQILTKVVTTIAREVKELDEGDTSYNGLLVRATNEYGDEYRRILQDRIGLYKPDYPKVPTLGQEDATQKIIAYFRELYAYNAETKKQEGLREKAIDSAFGEYFYNLTERVKLDPGVGIILLLPIWQDRAAALIKAEGATEAMIPMLQRTHDLLKRSPRTKLLAERGTIEKDEDAEKFDRKHKITAIERKDYEWIRRQEDKLEGVWKVGIQLIAQAAGEFLNRLKAIEARKRQFRPAKPVASAPAPSAAGDSGTAKPIKRW